MTKQEFIEGLTKRKAMLKRHGMIEEPMKRIPVDMVKSITNTKNSAGNSKRFIGKGIQYF